jgi:hypothetical protein
MARKPRASARTLAQLSWEVANINQFLGEFGVTVHGETRAAELNATGEFIRVFNMPLPDGYRPDHCDLVLIVDDFPACPPVGLYLLNKDAALVVRQMEARFNAFQNLGFHGAPSLPGYTWICFHFSDNTWRYRADAPAQGDNLRKFLGAFFAELAADGGR